MAAQVPSASLLPIPAPYSIQPVMYWMTAGEDFDLGENIQVVDAVTQQSTPTRIRAINCKVDLTNPAGTAIVYLAENGQQMTYYAHYSGQHPFNAWAIISIAAGISAASFQAGV